MTVQEICTKSFVSELLNFSVSQNSYKMILSGLCVCVYVWWDKCMVCIHECECMCGMCVCICVCVCVVYVACICVYICVFVYV